MSRRGRKEDWGGADSDDEDGMQAQQRPAGAGGMSSLLGRGLSKSALAAERRGAARAGEGDGGGASSDDEDDSGADSGAEGDEAAADETRNAKERDRSTVDASLDTEGLTERARQRGELKHTARMKQQGLSLDEEDDDGQAGAAAAAADDDDGDEGKASDAMADAPRELTYREKMNALFDKKKTDKFMTFDADDPLKPNPSQHNTEGQKHLMQ